MKQPLKGSSTATHRALSITEIQTLAFDLGDSRIIEASTSLLNVALTCRGFTDVALDYLWETIDSPEKLFHVWYGSGVTKPAKDVEGNEESYESIWARDPTPAEWLRFAYYSRRIRTMEAVKVDVQERFFGDFFDRFGQANSSRKKLNQENGVTQDLFLRLESLTWECVSETDYGPNPNLTKAAIGCHVILGEAPRLRSLDVLGDAVIWHSLLDAITGDRPSFGTLAIRCNPALDLGVEQNPMTMERTAGALCRLMERYHLQRLKLPGWLLGVQDVQHAIFDRPTLIDLEICWDNNGRFLLIDVELLAQECRRYVLPGPNAFPVLGSLRGELFDIKGLFGTFSFKNLETLDITPPEGALASLGLLRGFMGAVGVCCSALLQFNVRTQVELEEDDPPSAGPAAIVRMQGCSLIYSFTLDLWWDEEDHVTAPYDFNPSDDDWLLVAKAWPKLATLVYACTAGDLYSGIRSPSSPVPRASITILSSFDQYCGRLRKLNVPFYARGGTLSLPCRNRSGSLVEMEVTQAWIDDDATTVKETARYLEGFMRTPGFTLKVPSCLSPEAYQAVWSEAATAEERLRCGAWKEVKRLLATWSE